MKKMSSNRRNGIQLLFMIVLSVLSQVVALYKSRFTAVTFGASNYMDAYNFALNIGTFVFAFVTTGITTVVVPAYVKKTDKKAVNSFITIIYGVVLCVLLLILVFRFPLVKVLTHKGDEFTKLACSFLFITFLMQGITAFLAVTTAYFQCINHYIIPKMVTLVSNVLVAVILISGVIKSFHAYMFLLVLGAFFNFVVDVTAAVKLGFRYKPAFDIHSPELKKMLVVFAPTLFSSGLYKIHSLVDTTIAANLAVGQLTILSYTTSIITMVNHFIIGNLTVYVYPKVVARLGKPDERESFWGYNIFFHGVVTLLIAGFFSVGYEACSIIFLGGKFTAEDTQMLYKCACVYIFGQQINIVRDLVYRYFYANGNTQETFKNSVVVSITNIVLSLIFVQFWGLMGIIIGTVLSSLCSYVMILIKFRKNYGLGKEFLGVLVEYGKNLLALFVSVGVVLLTKHQFPIHGTIVSILVFGVETVVIFVLILLLTRSKIRHVKI